MSVGQDDSGCIVQSSPSSVNSLQIALFALKERCSKQNMRIEDLEQENLVLTNSRADLYVEIKKLHEANVKLREKNLSLNQELHQKNKENCEIRQKLEGDRARHARDVRQLERLQQEVINRTTARTISMEPPEIETISSLEPDKEDPADNDAGEEEVKELLVSGTDKMTAIKTSLISQQAVLVSALSSLQEMKTARDQRDDLVVSTISQVLSSGGLSAVDEVGRCCPMCEAQFPDHTQDQFESHVLSHFSYEDSDTLTNFDTLPDAPWRGLDQLAEG